MKKSAFLHIPKCAGQSLGPFLEAGFPSGHVSADSPEWAGRAGGAFTVVFVRHPLARMQSMWRWLKTLHNYPERCNHNAMMQAFGTWGSAPLEVFLQEFPWEEADALTNFFRPASWFLARRQFDFVGRFERLESDIVRLEKILQRRLPIPHRNKGEGPQRSLEELKRIVRGTALEDRLAADWKAMRYEED